MAFELNKYEGAGLDNLDNSGIPLLRILQDQSPEVNARKKEYIEGAVAGDFMFVPTRRAIKGPLEIIPLAVRTCYVEWKPRDSGGGIVAHHGLDIIRNPQYRKEGYDEFLGNNELVNTTYWAILFNDEGEWTKGIIAFTSSQLKVSRRLSREIQNFAHPALPPKTKAPIFSRKITLGSEVVANSANQEYFNYDVQAFTVLDLDSDEELLNTAVESMVDATEDLARIAGPGTEAQPPTALSGASSPPQLGPGSPPDQNGDDPSEIF